MLIKHISGNTFDIFFNDGWENWARFKRANNALIQIAGVAVPQNIQHYLKKKYGVSE